MKKLLVVDGNSILNRAFYGIRALSNREGFPTNAIYGALNIILKQMDELEPDGLVAAFDVHAPTFRHEMYDAYKAGRRPTPEELKLQFPVAKECLTALGFCVVELAGYEADDILGTLSKMAGEAGAEAYVLTGDRDSLQLIGEGTTVLLATNTDTLFMNRDAFRAKYGVEPEQFVDVKALMGDSSDNIPGVPGIGEKTALSLISQFSTLDGVFAGYADAKLTPSVKTKLENGKDSAYLSQKLARICREVPLGQPLSAYETRGEDKAALLSLFTRLEFTGLIKRLGLGDTPLAHASEETLTVTHVSASELPDAEEVAVSENDGVFSVYCGDALYVFDGTAEELVAYLRGKKVIVYDAKTLYHALDTAGQRYRDAAFDVMLAAYVVDSGEGHYGVERLVTRFLGEAHSQEIPEAVYAWRLYPVLDGKLRESGQEPLFADIEMPLCAVLADMEKIGFCVDAEGIAAYGEELASVADQLAERIYYYAGGEFNINSPKQLGEVLFERLGLKAGKKTQTGYSTNAEVLEKLRYAHPIVDDVLEYRQVTKLKGTYAEGLLKEVREDGRIHTVFKQTGTATGRLSSAEPNLQNIPIKTELGRRFRRYFIPKNDEYALIDADYSQIELRLLAAVSRDETMTEAFLSGGDIHASTASTVFHVSPEQVTPELRKRAKAVNFGIMYGIGEFSLSEDLGISRAEAKAYIEQYLAGYPGIDAYLHAVVREGYDKGFVTTMFGRRRYIPELASHNKNLNHFGERVAMNSPIQGTAADIIKIAMIRVSKRLSESGLDAKLILQVHDELLIEANKNCVAEAYAILKEEMEHAVNLTVPMRVEIASGKNWLDVH